MVPQSRPSEDGDVNTCRARPNALDPTMTFQPNGHMSQFSPIRGMRCTAYGRVRARAHPRAHPGGPGCRACPGAQGRTAQAAAAREALARGGTLRGQEAQHRRDLPLDGHLQTHALQLRGRGRYLSRLPPRASHMRRWPACATGWRRCRRATPTARTWSPTQPPSTACRAPPSTAACASTHGPSRCTVPTAAGPRSPPPPTWNAGARPSRP